MSPSAPPPAATGPRGRRARRASGDDRERTILETAERLLEERPLSEISVEDLARGAGISRSAFYFYFSSRDAVLLTLVQRLVEESAAGRAEALAKLAEEPGAGWRQGLGAIFETFRARPAVILAGAALHGTSAEARKLWSEVTESWVADVTAVIEGERGRGAAPPGLPARDLAIALVQMNERVLHANFAGETPALGDGKLIDVLVEIWLRTIYGTAEPA
jgi:TetR/AcrR family transcriptional regulator, ethionamide resistance regulator